MLSITSTTSSSSSTRKRTIVPLLLESFPAPPSHIPLTSSSANFPSLSGNPPPSLPPSTPLPPLPGPSPISENDTLLFLSSSRSSKISLASTNSSSSISLSRPNSIASIASAGRSTTPNSPASTKATFGRHSRRESVTSVRSARSNVSHHIPNYPRSPSFSENRSYSISEEDPADLTRVDIGQLTTLSPMPPSNMDDNDNEKVLDLFPARSHQSRSFRPSSPPSASDSLASVDMQDLPADDGDGDVNSTSYSHAQALHRRMRASRSKSETHKQNLRSRSNNNPPDALPPSSESLPPVPTYSKTPEYQQKVSGALARAVSPDIKTIISATPRPRRASSGLINGSSTPSDSCSLSRPRTRSRKVMDATEVALGRTGETISVRSGAPYELMYTKGGVEHWEDDSFISDYGVQIDRTGYDGHDGLEPDVEARLERELEGDGSDSDSSLDLHTPLPHLMLRHGLLSPNSKLLPQTQEPPQSILPEGSVASTSTSTISKSGALKDERDTPKRRTRHRDGRLLRGGIGLTTGLGWSDSEDEDAPSALTRRISSLNLSRRSSASSVQSAPLPLTRSSSSGIILERKTTYDQEWASAGPNARTLHKTRSSLPPTSWQKRAVGGRTSTSSAGSTFSLALSIPEDHPPPLHSSPPPPISRTTSESSAPSETKGVRTPSTASTLSIPLPVTPESADISPPISCKEKVLPPLPGPTLRTYPSSVGLGMSGRYSVSRPRTYSSASSVSSAGRSSSWTSPAQSTVASTSSTPNTYTYTPSTPRPLQLTPAKSLRAPGERGSKEKSVPVPTVNCDRPRQSDSAPRSSVSSTSAPPTPTSIEKPKPRTGTGMIYRTSSSRMRMPSALSSASNLSNISLPRTSQVLGPLPCN